MVVERHTYERALQIEAQMAERGLAPIQGQQRRIDILKSAGLPVIPGPRHIRSGGVEYNVYTFAEAAMILLHPNLCWHMREAILKLGADRKAPWTLEQRRARWAAVLVALALGSAVDAVDTWGWCKDGRCGVRLAELL